MKIKNFIAKNVHGYLSYDINFNKDLTFLIGLNGCGKTTILKLISGLLSPNYFFLSQISFSELLLTLYDSNKDEEFTIKAQKNDNTLKLKVGKIEEKLDNFSQQNIDDLLYEQYIEKTEPLLLNKFNESKYSQEIKKYINPIVLGLDRRVRLYNYTEFKEMMYLPKRLGRFKLKYEGIDQALDDIKAMMYEQVRKGANIKDRITEKFKEDILSELINSKASPSIEMSLRKKINFEKEFNNLDNRKKRLNEINSIFKIESLQQSLNNRIDKAYKVLNLLKKFNQRESENNNKNKDDYKKWLVALLDWLNLQNQLNNIDQIIKIGTEYSNNIKEIDSSFNRLVESLNLFFLEIGKRVIITGEGDLQVQFKNDNNIQKNSIFELSSGEKQLIILFSHLAFAKDSNKDIFIIDEPELSLHLSWQEKFVSALQTVAPKMQFVLATHAPAIINKKEKFKKCVNLSKMVN